MQLSALLNGISHKILQTGTHPSSAKISSITIDSRKVQPGGMYICLRGLTVDGHSFIDSAAAKGATAVLVDEHQSCYPPTVTVIHVENARRAMSFIAANFYGHPAKKLRLIGVTGTNGKTTVTHFIDEILRKLGYKTGIIGTLGIKLGINASGETLDIPFATSTTPDPLELHSIFAKMAAEEVEFVVMEVSSHALALHKMEGLEFETGVFTNLTQDHLDFHGTMENYAAAKAQLFAQSKFAVLNADDDYTKVMLHHLGHDNYVTYGIDKDASLRANDVICTESSSTFNLMGEKFTLNLGAKFNVYNILATIGVIGTCDLPLLSSVISTVSGVAGRIQAVPNELGVQIFVDFAHTPDALENTISSIKEVIPGRVITLFGCGGDRDTTKRPIMGKIAGELSDFCIVTSDNPRTEDPLAIIEQITVGVEKTPTPYEICENRRDAIFAGVKMLKPGDALIIAGKGHEDYQDINGVKYPFSDYDTAVEAVGSLTPCCKNHALNENPLVGAPFIAPETKAGAINGVNLSIEEILQAVDGQMLHNTVVPNIISISTDSRKHMPGALFVPIPGEFFDGHNYINGAAEKGAICALTERADIPSDIPLILVKSTRRALMELAAYYRRKRNIKVVAVTGSAGKTITKDMIYHVLARKYKTKKTLGNFNNDIGLPLSIFQLEADDEALVLEMGMNHAMEIHELSKIGAPDVAVITHIGEAHIENFENREGILHAKLEIVDGMSPGGVVVLNGNDPLLTGPIAATKCEPFNVQFPSVSNIVSTQEKFLEGSDCHLNWRGHDIHINVPLPGAHMVMNALLATAVGIELGVSPEEITQGFDDFVPPSGRLTVQEIGGKTIINDAYNASPTAVIESLKILCGQGAAKRKVAILGDMNELGHMSEVRHREIGAFAAELGIDLLVAVGPQSRFIFEGFGEECKYFATVDEFLPKLDGLLLEGDLVLVKASRGMAFERIIEKLK